MKATYGVTGMMEWVALIPTRSNMLRVRFTGGSLSGYGVTPATFTTENEVVMRMIEESRFFLQGRIRLLSKTGVAGDGDPDGNASSDSACRDQPFKFKKRCK